MNEKQIIGAIMLATGLTVPEYAQARGCAKSTIYLNISGEMDTKRVREAILADVAKITAPVKITFPPRPKKAA